MDSFVLFFFSAILHCLPSPLTWYYIHVLRWDEEAFKGDGIWFANFLLRKSKMSKTWRIFQYINFPTYSGNFQLWKLNNIISDSQIYHIDNYIIFMFICSICSWHIETFLSVSAKLSNYFSCIYNTRENISSSTQIKDKIKNFWGKKIHIIFPDFKSFSKYYLFENARQCFWSNFINEEVG